jgi:hypothetical protein
MNTKKIEWACAKGHHCHTIEDDGETGTTIAIQQTRLRLADGCDHYNKKEKCGAKVSEAVS